MGPAYYLGERELHQGDVEAEAGRHWSDVATSQGVPSTTRSKEWALSVDLPRSRFYLKSMLNFYLPNFKWMHSCFLIFQACVHLLPSLGTNSKKLTRFLLILFPVGAFSRVGHRPFNMEGSGCPSASQTNIGCSPSPNFFPLWDSQVAR